MVRRRWENLRDIKNCVPYVVTPLESLPTCQTSGASNQVLKPACTRSCRCTTQPALQYKKAQQESGASGNERPPSVLQQEACENYSGDFFSGISLLFYNQRESALSYVCGKGSAKRGLDVLLINRLTAL